MTEAEWVACADPERMVEYLRFRGRDRKLRLVACAACRRLWDVMSDERSRRAIEASEQFADNAISYGALDRISGEAEEASEDETTEGRRGVAEYAASYASSPDLGPDLVLEVFRAVADVSETGLVAEHAAQARLIREIFGNPLHPASLEPSWLTPTVVSLAAGIYDRLLVDRLPILADALEDAGCTDPAILDHLRGPGPHVRGCWALDLILGKS
jgi:hypothetical protein